MWAAVFKWVLSVIRSAVGLCWGNVSMKVSIGISGAGLADAVRLRRWAGLAVAGRWGC